MGGAGGCYLVGILALHDVDFFVEVAVEEQAVGLVGDVGAINNESCKSLVDAHVARAAFC